MMRRSIVEAVLAPLESPPKRLGRTWHCKLELFKAPQAEEAVLNPKTQRPKDLKTQSYLTRTDSEDETITVHGRQDRLKDATTSRSEESNQMCILCRHHVQAWSKCTNCNSVMLPHLSRSPSKPVKALLSASHLSTCGLAHAKSMQSFDILEAWLPLFFHLPQAILHLYISPS